MMGSVYRRTSGIYVVRIVVPHRLRQAVGRTEIHASTGLREPNAAKLAALQIQLAWRKRLMELDSTKLKTGSPLLLTDGLIGLREAASLAGLPLKSLLAEMLNDRVPLYVQANGWRGWRVSDLRDIERDYDGTFILNDVECRGVQQALTGVASPYEIGAVISALIATDAAMSSLFRLPGAAAFFPDEPQPITASICFVQKPAVELIRSHLAGLLPAGAIAPAISPAMPVAGVAAATGPIIFDPITAAHGHKRFSELFEIYRQDRSWGEDQKRRMATEAGLFIELMDDPTLGKIERETIIEFAQRLATLPTDIYLSKRRFKVERLRELIAIASANGLELKNEPTIKRHVGHVSEILGYGVRNHMLRFNPAADFRRGRADALAKSAKDARDIFSPEDLGNIFSQAWFQAGAGKFEARGWTDWRPFNYWLPIMGLLTGGRINELSQLYLDDIVQSESDTGVWYFDFNLIQPDKTDADAAERDKSLKTMNAIRVVPVHDVLLRLGLPEYVAALRRAGHMRLFPELTRDRVKGYGKPAGSWFNERFLGKKLGMERNGRKVFHSLRHNFETALERLDASESVRAQLAGHQRGKTESGTRYSKDRNAAELKPLIDRLAFPCLSDIAPFQITAGLKAVKVSIRFKALMARSKAKADLPAMRS